MTDFVVNSEQSKAHFLKEMGRLYDQHRFLRIDIKTGKQRSGQQNRALHQWCGWVADALNERGLDFRQSLRQDVDVPWNRDLVKDYMWRVVQVAVTGKESTTQPHKDEYPQIYDVLNRHLIERFNIHVPWPTKEE